MKRIVVVGATGMIGGLVTRQALEHPSVGSVTTVGRRATGLDHPDLTEVEHADFGDLQPIASRLADHDALLFCLGAYTGAVPDDRFREITVDFAVEAARAFLDQNPSSTFCLLSGAGADRTERSRVSFARYKGMAENAIIAMPFGRVHVFRPGYIYPVTPRAEPSVSYRLLRALWPVMGRIYPAAGIASDALAAAMLDAAIHGTPEHPDPVIENRDIRAMAARLREAG